MRGLTVLALHFLSQPPRAQFGYTHTVGGILRVFLIQQLFRVILLPASLAHALSK
jgi:hypothetical protein